MLHARPDYMRIQDPLNKIGEDEPVFLLRAKDSLAPGTVTHWASALMAAGGDAKLVNMALSHADKMLAWQAANGCKLPDYTNPMPLLMHIKQFLLDNGFKTKDSITYSKRVERESRITNFMVHTGHAEHGTCYVHIVGSTLVDFAHIDTRKVNITNIQDAVNLINLIVR